MSRDNYHSELAKTAASYRKAYEAGRRAKAVGFSRVSPLKSVDEWVDWWFYAGYDGWSHDLAWLKFGKEVAPPEPEPEPEEKAEVVN